MTQQEVIQKFMIALSNSKAITGSAAVNEAFNEASGKRFSTMQEAIDDFLRDCKAAKNTDDFLRNYCGIILDNEDNGSITGLDAGGIKLKTDETIVLETSKVKRLDTQYLNQWDKWTDGKEVPLDNGNATVDKSGTLYFEKLGLTVKVPDYDKIIEAANDSDKAKSEEAQRKLIIINGLYSWWIEGALQLIKDSYGDEFSLENNKQSITVHLKNDGNNGTPAKVDFLGFHLHINMYYLSQIKNDDYNGQLSMESESSSGEYVNVPGEYLDNLLAHELTHAVMQAKFGFGGRFVKWNSLPKVIMEGTAEFTRGIDSIRRSSIIRAIEKHRESNYLSDILDDSIVYEKDELKYKWFDKDTGRERNSDMYSAGYMLLRYFAKQCADKPVMGGIRYATLSSTNEYIVTTEGNSTTNLGEKTTTIVKTENEKFSATVIGSAVVKQDEIRVHKNPLNIEGSVHDFSIIGGDGDDYVSVKGDNIIFNNIISNYNLTGGNDTINIEGNKGNIKTSNGNNIIQVIGNEVSTEVGTGNDKVTIVGSNARNITLNDGDDELLIEGDNNLDVDMGAGNDTVTVKGSNNSFSNRENDIDKFIITAEAKNNIIYSFEQIDSLNFESGEIAAQIQIIDDGIESVVISSATTGEILVVLSGVTSGSNDNIVYSTEDGKTVRTSIDWLLANTTPINPNPDDDTEVIDVPVNGNVNNTRDDVIINAVSGNNVIQNSGNNVTIIGGTDRDEVTNTGNNVTIDGKAGNDILSNGSDGDSSSSSQSTRGGDNVVINGGAGLDLIYNYGGLNVQLNGAEGADTLYNSGSNTTITGGDGDDSINNENASEVTISGGNGKDTISNISANVSIDGGDGIDFIYNGNYSISGGSNVSISGGEGNDYISNWGGSKLSISGGAGNDYIFNNGTNVTILGDVGDDTITNRGTNSTIYSGDGKDSIENRGNYTSIDMGEGDNRIWNMGTNTTIHSSTGNDTVHNGGAESHDAEDVKIETGAGNDSIHNIRDNVTIDAGADNDSIYNDGDNVSIVGNTGDDTIRSELSRNVTISSGDGNDSISNNSSYTTIDAGDGDDNITINASDVLIDAGAGKDSIFLSNAYRGTVNSGTDNDYIETYGRSAFIKINAGDGDDSIKNTASETTIISGTGDDSIDNDGSNVTIDAGDGNDIIYNDDENVSISSGNGNDTIIASTGDHTTINAGAGNDSIYLGSSRLERQTVIQYNSGDGHDTIHQFYLTSTLNITGEAYSTQRSGNDIIVKVGNGSITLKDIQGFTPNIQNTFNGDDTQSGGDDTQSGGDDTQSGGNDTQSGGNDTQSGGNDTQSGGDDTQSGGQDQTDTVRIVKNIVGLDLNYLDKVVVTDLDSLDDLIDERTVWLNFSSNSGGGFQNIDLSKSDYRQVVSLEGGNQKVTFNDTDRNVAIVGKNATGFKNIIFGNGDDVGLFFGSNAYTRATIGSGNDSILIDNNARVRLDMTKAEETSIIPYSGRVILDNYNPNSRASILFSDVNDVTGAIKDGTIKLVGDTVRSESFYVTVNDSLNGATLVNISSANGHIQKVGFTGINGGFIDAHDLRDDLLLKGNYAENSSDKQSGKRSTLISGTGNDTILAGARDTVDAGDGRNQIYLTPYDLREKKQGANIVLSGKGRNTVHSFQEGFDYDCVQVADLSNVEFKFQTDGLLLKSGDSRLKFDGIGIVETFSNSSGIPTNLDADEPEKITLTDGKRTINAVVAQTNQSVGVTKSNYYTPNAFFGNRSGLNFSNYRGDLNINLNDGTGTLDKVNATFQGINKLQAGTGMATLIGSDNRDTLIAGDGYSSLWGGAGNDKLIGRASSTDKDGRTTFFFFAGDGHDVIYDFNFLTPQNYYSGDTDKINIGDCDINDAYCSGDDVVLALDDDSYLTIKNAKEKNFQINHMIAQVGNELHYDGIANTFANNGNRSSSLIVDSSIRSAEIWLDSSHGTLFFGHISTLDASAVDGRTSLVGNEFNNTIIAGQDDASLWGGSSSSDDLLIGGNSRNTFFYCNGNGRDTIQATTDKDFVILSDVFLDEIVSTNISADFVDINFIDGGSLRINGNYNVTYQLADGSRYSANHEHLEWDSR